MIAQVLIHAAMWSTITFMLSITYLLVCIAMCVFDQSAGWVRWRRRSERAFRYSLISGVIVIIFTISAGVATLAEAL